mmetsp:Transcript_14010/g.19446  ORF Transcript_14010/g.19446 Transcript_14010/m.19446 type:complete len:196 (-) Transcript_14010:694-1281(-)
MTRKLAFMLPFFDVAPTKHRLDVPRSSDHNSSPSDSTTIIPKSIRDLAQSIKNANQNHHQPPKVAKPARLLKRRQTGKSKPNHQKSTVQEDDEGCCKMDDPPKAPVVFSNDHKKAFSKLSKACPGFSARILTFNKVKNHFVAGFRTVFTAENQESKKWLMANLPRLKRSGLPLCEWLSPDQRVGKRQTGGEARAG